MKKLVLFFCFVLAVTLAGCATPNFYAISVNSITAPDKAPGNKYVLWPGQKDVQPDDLQFVEFSSYVHNALRSRGFSPASGTEQPDLVILVDYGIGSPKEKYSLQTTPVFGVVGGGVSTFESTTSGKYGTRYSTGTITTPPQFGVTGYSQQMSSHTTYERYLTLVAFDNAVFSATEKAVQLWKTSVTSRGISNDLRRVFPYMLYAAQPYLGVNSGQMIDVKIDDGDESVLKLRGQNVP